MILVMLLYDFLYLEAWVQRQVDLLSQTRILFTELVKNTGHFVIVLLDISHSLVVHYRCSDANWTIIIYDINLGLNLCLKLVNLFTIAKTKYNRFTISQSCQRIYNKFTQDNLQIKKWVKKKTCIPTRIVIRNTTIIMVVRDTLPLCLIKNNEMIIWREFLGPKTGVRSTTRRN